MKLLLLLLSLLRLWRRSDGTGAALNKVQVKEGDDAILPCSFSSESIRQVLFDWKKDKKNKMDKDQEVFMYDKGELYKENDYRQDEQFRGRVFHFPEHLDEGNASIIIRDTKLTDSGNYTCVFPHLHPGIETNIVLVVGAAPKPSVTILDGTTDWAQLQCSVRGAFPKPDVRWQNRAGDIVPAEEPQVSERGGSYDIILQTTVTKTDHYRCVSTQEEIHHQTEAEIFVLLNGAAPEPHIKILGETKEGVQLQCSVRGASPKPEVYWLDGDKNIVPAEEPQVNERGGGYDIILQTTVTKTDHYRCVATQEEINHQTEAETYVPVHGVALPPYVKIRNVTGDGVLLECFVRDAYPQPEVEWRTSDGMIVPAEEPQVSHRGHRFDVLLLTTVKKTNMYHCVVKQDGFGHVIHNELFVPDNLFEDKSCHCTSVPMVAIITIFSTLVIEHLVGFLVKTIMNWRKKLLKRWSRDVERDAAEAEAEAEAGELKSPLPDSDAEPDEAEAGKHTDLKMVASSSIGSSELSI